MPPKNPKMGATNAKFQAGNITVTSDPDREFLIETNCCVTGAEVKHSFCRYPDNVNGTLMVMSHDAMLKYSQGGQDLINAFETVLAKRREAEKESKGRKK